MPVNEVFATVGESGIREVVAAFYRQVPDDSILGPMYPRDDMEGAEQRLRSFLVYRFGGPDTYLSERGHPRLRMRHAPFAVNQAARDRWVDLMTTAIDGSSLADEVKSAMKVFLADVATFLLNR
ncbi:MAG: globin [Planctomycetaceae bacterium]|nr:globin [Planctomycetaceae bacterium]